MQIRHLNGTIVNAMKLTPILLLIAVFQVSANTTAQTVNYVAKQVGLQEVFTVIKEQTGYTFFYNRDDLQGTHAVNINFKNTPLTEALDIVLAGQNLRFSILKKTIFIERKDIAKDLSSAEAALAPQGDVRGRVMDENDEPLAGATIKLNGTNLMTTTDSKGYYKIENVPQGDYTIVITFVGYATRTNAVKIAENGMVNFDFKMSPSLVNLDQLTVTSTLSKRAIRAYPATIAVIKQEDLKNRNLNNIADVLESVPGIIISPGSERDNSGRARQPSGIIIRGISGSASGYIGVNSTGIKYLVDGVEIISTGGQFSVLQTLDPNDIENIEILKGPMASTLYGSGAASGVISITTKKGKVGKTKVNFKTMFTQYANDYADYSGYSKDYSLNVSGGSEQFNYLLGAAYNLYPTTKLTDVNNGIDQKTWSYTTKIRGKVKNIAADLSLQYGKEDYGSGSTAISENKYRASLGLAEYPVFPLDDIKNAQRSFMTTLHLTQTLATNWYHDLTIGYNINNNSQTSYSPDYQGNYTNRDYVYTKMNARYFMFYDHSWTKEFKSSITAGFEYNGFDTHYNAISSATPFRDFFTASTPAIAGTGSYSKAHYSSAGYFAELVTGLKNNLFLTTGIRFDVNNAYGDNVGAYAQPRVGLSYVVEQGAFKIKPRIVWGVSSQAPDPSYKTTNIQSYPGYTFINAGNADIKPQRSQGYEYGADIFYGSNYSLNITYYNQKIKDMILLSQTYDGTTNPPTYTNYYYNIADALNKGLEISARALVDPFTLDISYTKSVSKWGKDIGQDPTANIYPGAPISSIPKSSFFARLTYKVPSFLPWSNKGGRISLDWRYNGSAYDFNAISYYLDVDAWNNAPDPKPAYPNFDDYYIWMKGYSNFNLRADYSVTNYAVLYIDIQNLMDKQGSVNGQSYLQYPGRRINFGFNINF